MVSTIKKGKIPIEPLTEIRLKKLWPHARKQGHEIGEIKTVGYYRPQDGLDCIWLIDQQGNYSWTIDHEFLYTFFEIHKPSLETDLYGENVAT
jgi:hypothetical protein